MKTKRLSSIFAATVLSVSSILSVGLAPMAHAASGSDTCVWTGATDLKFSTAANWSNCSGAAPVAGDVLSFGVIGSNASYSLNNDLGFSFGGISYGDSTKDGSNFTSYDINTLQLADNATITKVNAQGVSYSNVGLSLPSAAAFTVGNHLTLDGNYVLIGATTDSFDIPVQNLTIKDTGLTTLSQTGGGGGGGGPTISFRPVTLNVDTGSEYSVDSTVTTVNVQDGARIYLDSSLVGSPSTLTINMGASTAAAPGLVATSDLNLKGNITLSGDTYYYIFGTHTLTVSGALSGSGSLKMGTGSTGTFTNSASSNTSQTPGGTTTVPVTELPAVTDSQPTTNLDVAPKTSVALDGSRNYVTVYSGATLKGTGTAGYLYVSQDGIVAPGHSPGKLTVLHTLDLAGGSTYQAELKDTTAGDYDQLVVGNAADTDNTNPDVTLGDSTSSPILAVSLYTGYKIKAGDKFTIIDNLSKTDVKGTFKDLAEGATLNVNGAVFTITYKGGDGNDVVLTAKTIPTTPDTGFALASTHPGATLGITVIAAGVIFGIARRMRRSPVRVASARKR